MIIKVCGMTRGEDVEFCGALGIGLAVPALLDVVRKGSESKQVRNACLAVGAVRDPPALAQPERWRLGGARREEPAWEEESARLWGREQRREGGPAAAPGRRTASAWC